MEQKTHAELGEILSDKASQVRSLKDLLDHPAWRVYRAALMEQEVGRRGTILLQPLKALDEALAQEFMKGEVSGLNIALITPGVIIEQLEADIRVLNIQLEQKNEDDVVEAVQQPAGGSRSRVDDERFYTDGKQPDTGS